MSHPIGIGGRPLRSVLRALTAELLRCDPSDVDERAALTALGLDSLSSAELIAAIEDELAVTLPPSLLFDHPSLDAIATFLERGAGSYTGSCTADALRNMRRDAVLPEEVRPLRPGRAAEQRCVLVTGATGFVGAHLVRALLDAGTGTVHCLVRGEQGTHRVRETMERYGVSRPSDFERIIVHRGELSAPTLGLDRATYARLATEVDAIIHAAAAVDWVQPYPALRDANVAGTAEMLRLACAGRPAAFHFVSSMAACYATTTRDATETLDPMRHLAGLPLGYAQSKAVAEALVRQAGARGLPVRIIRPALVAGDSRTGICNADDLLGLLIRGCVFMGAAPDLDWRVDAVPADQLARAIVALPAPGDGGADVVHVVSPRPRNWRECVLYLHLRGHPLRLLPYAEWARLLLEGGGHAAHPLSGLRGFLLREAPDAAGIHLPELYEEVRITTVDSRASAARLSAVGAIPAALGPDLLERHLLHYERVAAFAPGSGLHREARRALDPEPLRAALERRLLVGDMPVTVSIHSAEPLETDESLVADLTSWRSGAATGLFQATFSAAHIDAVESIRAIVKVKCEDRHVLDVAEAVATLCDPTLGAAYHSHREHSGFVRGHLREIALYEQDDPRWRAHTPAVLATTCDPAGPAWIVALEHVTDFVRTGGADHPWAEEHIAVTLDGLARLHAIWYGRTEALPAEWLAPRRTAEVMRELQPLWAALARHARPLVLEAGGVEMARTHAHLAEHAAEWAAASDAQVQALIHHDFNPRNILLRNGEGVLRLCAFDWELARIGVPQRDVAELLCFVLPPESAATLAPLWMEHARAALAAATGRPIAAEAWRQGFIAALRETLVDRLASYAMVHRIRTQRFLPRILRTWHTMYSSLAR